MATLMPSPITAIADEPLNSESLHASLRPWRRRLAVQQVLRWTMFGLIAGLILASSILLVAHLIPWASATYGAIGLGTGCLFLTLVAAVWFHPNITQTAHIVDTRLALHDRMSTAWELRNEISVISTLQRRDALRQLEKQTPTTAIPLRQQRSTLLILFIVTVILAFLVVMPNPMLTVLQQQAAFQARIAKQIATIKKIQQQVTHLSTLSPVQQTKIDKILSDLESQLKQAKNDTQAQQAIAQAQAKLDQLRNPSAVTRANAHNAASASLHSSSNPTLTPITTH